MWPCDSRRPAQYSPTLPRRLYARMAGLYTGMQSQLQTDMRLDTEQPQEERRYGGKHTDSKGSGGYG
ncbi:hypothetical protein cyc_03288 [Cyclospora cayetanensis]|uniref:Uncharacterized protein n=1 Tax=Cyclospora cayetanensis TaxID=88456 RepID=A0A1D3CRM0_9EIME|nr:hypothetical protein cyc_03288 [Cyclospora cayetanensis]